MLYVVYFSSIVTNHVLYQDYVLHYYLCFRKICKYVNFFSPSFLIFVNLL